MHREKCAIITPQYAPHMHMVLHNTIMGFAIMQARVKITQRGAKLGIDFDAEVAKLRAAADWNQELQVSVTYVSAC